MVERGGRERGREALERQPQKQRQRCSSAATMKKMVLDRLKEGALTLKSFSSVREEWVCERQIGRVCACVRACVHAYVSEREVVN